jgi:hypothetical protein
MRVAITTNGLVPTPDGLITIQVPVATWALKGWCVGSTCNGVAGYKGSVAIINRVVAKITVRGEDLAGDKLSAQGSIAVYLADYAPYPTKPTDPANLKATEVCFGVTIGQYWAPGSDKICP